MELIDLEYRLQGLYAEIAALREIVEKLQYLIASEPT